MCFDKRWVFKSAAYSDKGLIITVFLVLVESTGFWPFHLSEVHKNHNLLTWKHLFYGSISFIMSTWILLKAFSSKQNRSKLSGSISPPPSPYSAFAWKHCWHLQVWTLVIIIAEFSLTPVDFSVLMNKSHWCQPRFIYLYVVYLIYIGIFLKLLFLLILDKKIY